MKKTLLKSKTISKAARLRVKQRQEKSRIALKKFRLQIDQADRQILQALAKRARIVQKVARAKAKLNLPIVHTARRAQIQKERPLWGEKLGLDKKYCDRIFRAIQAESVRCQKKIVAQVNRKLNRKTNSKKSLSSRG